MANLEFCDTYNMVAYLKKPEGSKEFHKIVDFLNASHIRYALTKYPTIYVSLIKQFWETATARTLDNGEIELTAIIDGKGEGSTHPSPVADEAAFTCVDVRYRGSTTTVTGLEAGQGSGNIDKTPTMPHDLPLLIVNTLGSDKGSMIQQELMVFCTTLSKKVESLETDLKQTKLIYGAAYTRLIKKVKKLENIVKSSQARRRARIIVSDDEDDLEDPSK
ncbi:hypothetical protein Tco_1416697 [Tanacetum coccineum]